MDKMKEREITHIGIKAISIDKGIKAECKFIKLSKYIHPKNHKKAMMSIYFEIQNNSSIPIKEIIFYFSPSTKITKIEDKTKTYTKKYRKFIDADFKPKNHPASYYFSGATRSNILVKFDNPIPPKEIGSTLFKIEFECPINKKPLLRRIMIQGDAWKFEFWTWNRPERLEKNQKLLKIKEEDIWIMIPETLYRLSKFLKANPKPDQSRFLTREEINERNYDKKWVRPETYFLYWNIIHTPPKFPYRQIYSVRYVTGDIPAISLVSFLATMVTLFSLSIDVKSKTFLGPHIYLILAFIFVLITLLAVIYSCSFFRFSIPTR